jgi:hypothetical protein
LHCNTVVHVLLRGVIDIMTQDSVSAEPTADELLQDLVATIQSHPDKKSVSRWIDSVATPLSSAGRKVLKEGRSGTTRNYPGDTAAEEIWKALQATPESRELLGQFSKKVSCQKSAIRDALHLIVAPSESMGAEEEAA